MYIKITGIYSKLPYLLDISKPWEFRNQNLHGTIKSVEEHIGKNNYVKDPHDVGCLETKQDIENLIFQAKFLNKVEKDV